MAVIMVLAGIAIPNFMSTLHAARLKGGVTDFASLLQTARLRAVDDDRYYSVYVLAAAGNNPQQGYVDIFPQNADGTSGTGGAAYNAGDPLVLLCHKRGTQQTGQQGSCLSRNLASLIRSVAIECGLCRSARTRRAARPEVGRNFLGA
jgi:hypothetical protein